MLHGVIRSAIQLQDRMTPALRSITTALNVTISSFEALQRASHNTIDTASLATARRELASAEVAINQVEQEIREANNAQQNFNSSVRNGGSAMDGLVGKVRSLASAYLGVKAAQQGMDAVDTYSNNKARLSLIVEEPKNPSIDVVANVKTVGNVDTSAQDTINAKMQATEDLQDKIFEASQRARANYDAMQHSVAKLGLLAGKSFANTDEIIAFTELMQKAFKVSGADPTESANAMYQLTQAMASGRLQGDEFRSIIENAPMLANAIGEYTGVGQEGLKELSSDGAISADIIKNSLFSAADDIESKYAQIPLTFADIWNDITNTVKKQSEGLMNNVSSFINSNTAAAMVDGIKYALVGLISVLGIVLGMVQDTGQFFIDNWSWIEPLIWGIVGAMAFYTGVLAIHNGVQVFSNALDFISEVAKYRAAKATLANASAHTAEALATAQATVAQAGFNTALAACPITWIILAIIALITIIYAAVGAINHFAGTSYSATGFICGVFATAGAFIWNTIMGVINAILQIINTVANIIISVVEWVLNVCTGGFNSFGDAVANLIGNIISWFLNLGEVVTKIIDAIFGTNWTSGLESLSNAVQSWGKNDKAVTLDRLDYQVDARLAYSDAYNAGYKFGQGIDEKVSSLMDFMPKIEDPTSDIPDYDSMINGIGEGIGNIDKNTGRTADKLEATDEDLKYLRDLAEQEVVNRFTTAKISLEMTNHNNINSDLDIDGIVDAMGEKLYEAMEVAAEGVH